MEVEPVAPKPKKSFRLTVEPVLLLFVFTQALSDAVITNLLLRQACWHFEGATLDQCTDHKQTAAQQKVSFIDIFKMLIETFVPTILSLFIGPWSDTNGRKLLLVLPLIGHIISYSTWGLLSLVRDLHPGYLLFSSLGIACSGGYVTIFIACYCYLADVTDEKNRVLRMGMAEGSMNLGQLSGYFLSPYVFKSINNGYWIVFLTNVVILSLITIYVILYVPETIHLPKEERTSLIRLGHLKDSYKTVMLPRNNYGRLLIFLYTGVIFLGLFNLFGEGSIRYLSTIKSFQWDIQQFTLYYTVALLGLTVGSSGGIWLGGTIMKIANDRLLMFSLLLRVASGILMGLSNSSALFYFGTLLASFKSFNGPLVRTQLSKIISQNDLGKVFSFLSTVEAITPQIAVPTYSATYAALVASFPLAIYFVSASICALDAIVVWIVMILKRISPRKTIPVIE